MTMEKKDKEWSGSPAVESPDGWWVDDFTGEYINADSNERMSAEAGRRRIAAEATPSSNTQEFSIRSHQQRLLDAVLEGDAHTLAPFGRRMLGDAKVADLPLQAVLRLGRSERFASAGAFDDQCAFPSLALMAANQDVAWGKLINGAALANLEHMQQAISEGADVAQFGPLALKMAVAYADDADQIYPIRKRQGDGSVGSKEIIESLFAAGVSPNALEGAVFVAACSQNNASIVKCFIAAGADVNVDDGAPLAIALKSSLLKTLKELLDAGARLDAPAVVEALAYIKDHNAAGIKFYSAVNETLASFALSKALVAPKAKPDVASNKSRVASS